MDAPTPCQDGPITIKEKTITKMLLFSQRKSSSELSQCYHPKTNEPSNLG